MSNLTITPAGVTMSSREIAELAGKEHRNVMRDIRAMLSELHGEGGVLSFEHTHQNPQNGQEYPIFLLPRREVEILLTGYSIPLRAKVIDRLRELESQLAPRPTELSRMEILQLAMESEQGRLKAETERDKAIRAKAQIGSRREAQAMAKASAAVREVSRLKKELDDSVKHGTVAAVERALHELLGKVLPVSSKKSQTSGAKRTRAWRERKKAAAEIDKQQIGSKREAAAMAKASAATLEVQRLKGELGRHAEHATVIAVERATGKKWPKNTYVALRRWCKRNNAMPVDVIDERYGTVKSWPAGAWLEAYGICLAKLFPVAPL